MSWNSLQIFFSSPVLQTLTLTFIFSWKNSHIFKNHFSKLVTLISPLFGLGKSFVKMVPLHVLHDWLLKVLPNDMVKMLPQQFLYSVTLYSFTSVLSVLPTITILKPFDFYRIVRIAISQCGNFKIFLSFIFYVKSILKDLEVLHTAFLCHFEGSEFY